VSGNDKADSFYIVSLADLHPFRFLSLRQHEAKETIILRAPRGTLFTAIRCTGDEGKYKHT
jgi:hypothetical protein